MGASFAQIVGLLRCPDDAEPLRYAPGELLCPCCARRFSIYEEDLAEILPSRPHALPGTANPQYRNAYIEAFEQNYRDDETSLAWGAEESVSQTWALKRFRQVKFVRPLISEGNRANESVLCDISAGAGYYTFAYAPAFRFVLHCDLSVSNLSYARRKARALGIRNILFIRADYFAPPFKGSLDRLLCLDTLIRGEGHDFALLTAIANSLKPTGCAIVDFHNWWHNPLRRLGLLPENFNNNRSYRRAEAEHLLRAAGIEEFSLMPFLQEFDADSATGRQLARIVPPTRLVYRFAPYRKRKLDTAALTMGTSSLGRRRKSQDRR